MAINTQSILSTLETKIASMDSNTPLDDMIVNIKSYQEAGGVVSIQYDSSGAMPILDSAQAGLVLYSASDTALYGFNGNTWAAVSNAAAGDAGGGAVSWTVDLSNVTYDSVSFSTAVQGQNNLVFGFNLDGTKMYALDNATDSVYQYTLSTAFDLSTASYDSVSYSLVGLQNLPLGGTFNADGTKMYTIGSSSDSILEHSLSTAFDLSTASYDNVSLSVASQDTSPRSVVFNPDGTKMYMAGSISDSVHLYSLSTAFDLSTASYDNVSFNAGSQDDNLSSVKFNSDGTKMYLTGLTSDSVYQYSLSTGFDISTASYDNVSLNLSSVVNNPFGLIFNSDGTKMYAARYGLVYQYSTGL